MRKILQLAFAAAVTACALVPRAGQAQTNNDLNVCRNLKADADDIIRTCSVFIRTRRAVGGRRAPANAISAIFVLRAMAYERQNDFGHAVEDLGQALSIAPGNYRARALRANAYSVQQDYTRALEDIDRAIPLVKEANIRAEDHGIRANIYLYRHEFARALADYDEQIRLAPTSVAALRGRAQVHQYLGDNARADADYAAATRLDPASRQKFEDDKEFNAHWIAYLKTIQDERNYPNWSGPPFDLFRRGVGTPPAAGRIDAKAAPAGDCGAAAVHWTSAESIHTRAAYEDHLARFPNCAFADLARARLAALENPGKTERHAPPKRVKRTSHRSVDVATEPVERAPPSSDVGIINPGIQRLINDTLSGGLR